VEKKLAKLKAQLEASEHKVTDMADKDVRSSGFVGGIGEHQKRNQPSPEQDTELGTAPDSE